MTVQGFDQEMFIHAGGFRTRYLTAGPESSETCVVLLHDGGFGGCAESSWASVAPLLAAQGIRVLAPDLLGFGGTDKAIFFDRSAFEFRWEHVVEFFDSLSLPPSHFVGNSMGASMLLRALPEASAKGRVKTAVSICGTGGPWRIAEAMTQLSEYDGSLEQMAGIMDFCIDRDLPEFDFDAYTLARHARSLAPGHYEALAAARLRAPWLAAATPSTDYPTSLRGCEIPVLLMSARDDPTNAFDWTEQIRRELPSAEVAHVDGKHSPNVDRPALIVDRLVEWVRAHE